MKNIKKYPQSELGVQSPKNFSDFEDGIKYIPSPNKKKFDENIQVNLNTKPKPKQYKDEEIQQTPSQDTDDEVDAIPKKNELRSSASNYFEKQKPSSKPKYRTVEDLYKNNKQPIIYSNDPNQGRKIKNFAQLNQSLNKKYSDSDSNYNNKLLKSKSKHIFNPSLTQHKPKNVKDAMNILLES